MATSLRKRAADFVDNALAPLEEAIYRRGYFRSIAAIVGVMIGVVGALGVFGLQIVFFFVGSFALLCLVVIGLAAVFATRRLREAQRRLALVLQDYGRALENVAGQHALVVRSHREEVTVSKRGDLTRKVVYLLGASSKVVPHYLRTGYSVDSPMTEHQRRQVVYDVYRRRAGSKGTGVRVRSTSSWEMSQSGMPVLALHAYIGNDVREGDEVTFHMRWPGASAALRQAADSEEFTLRFAVRAHPAHYILRLRKVKTNPSVVPIEETTFNSGITGRDFVVEFSSVNPALGDLVGVEIDFRLSPVDPAEKR